VNVLGLEKDERGMLIGARADDRIAAKDGETREPFSIRAKVVINATGPFTGQIRQMDDPDAPEIVASSAGVHVILPDYYSPDRMGLIDPSTPDGRVLFFLPWQGNTIAGTTESLTPITQNPVPSEKDTDWILSQIQGYLSSDVQVRKEDILGAWAGIRPLVKDPSSRDSESLVRSHLIDVSKSCLLTCAGGKWTTYRQMAEETVDAAIKRFDLQPSSLKEKPNVSGTQNLKDSLTLDGNCQTHNLKLAGAQDSPKCSSSV